MQSFEKGPSQKDAAKEIKEGVSERMEEQVEKSEKEKAEYRDWLRGEVAFDLGTNITAKEVINGAAAEYVQVIDDTHVQILDSSGESISRPLKAHLMMAPTYDTLVAGRYKLGEYGKYSLYPSDEAIEEEVEKRLAKEMDTREKKKRGGGEAGNW